MTKTLAVPESLIEIHWNWNNENGCGRGDNHKSGYCDYNFPRKDGYDPATQNAMVAIFILSFFILILGIVTLCKIIRRKKRMHWRVILFFTCAFCTLIVVMLYCLTAKESGDLDTRCFTTSF